MLLHTPLSGTSNRSECKSFAISFIFFDRMSRMYGCTPLTSICPQHSATGWQKWVAAKHSTTSDRATLLIWEGNAFRHSNSLLTIDWQCPMLAIHLCHHIQMIRTFSWESNVLWGMKDWPHQNAVEFILLLQNCKHSFPWKCIFGFSFNSNSLVTSGLRVNTNTTACLLLWQLHCTSKLTLQSFPCTLQIYL